MEKSNIVKNHLIFHFFITKGWKKDNAYKIHFRCLEYFRDVFDDVSFFLATEEKGMDNDIREVEAKLLGVFFNKGITFKIIPNTYLNESETFYNEIINSDKHKDELVFFAHTKGISNKSYSKENIYNWILILYYYNLNFIDDVYKALQREPGIFYGTLKVPDNTDANNGEKKKRYMYAGTFYWMNASRLYTKSVVYNRWMAELYPTFYDTEFMSTYKDMYFIRMNAYCDNPEEIIQVLENYSKEGIEKYNEFKKHILKDL